MRKFLCALMMILTLTACGGTGGGKEAEELALTIRGEYLAMTSCAANAVLTADYGQRIYRYEVAAAVTGEETVLTLSAPDTVAGLTARLSGKEGRLEFDGAILETGALSGDGLTPMTAIPALLQAARSGYLDTCTLETLGETSALQVVCRDPEIPAGTGTETALWFDPTTHALLRGEISSEGRCVIQCEFSQFTRDTSSGVTN